MFLIQFMCFEGLGKIVFFNDTHTTYSSEAVILKIVELHLPLPPISVNIIFWHGNFICHVSPLTTGM